MRISMGMLFEDYGEENGHEPLFAPLQVEFHIIAFLVYRVLSFFYPSRQDNIFRNLPAARYRLWDGIASAAGYAVVMRFMVSIFLIIFLFCSVRESGFVTYLYYAVAATSYTLGSLLLLFYFEETIVSKAQSARLNYRQYLRCH